MFNVRKQVTYALQIYQNKVHENKLIIIGAVFDFANDMGNGHGKLNIVSINGKDIQSIQISNKRNQL